MTSRLKTRKTTIVFFSKSLKNESQNAFKMRKYTFKSLYKNKTESLYQILVVYLKCFNFILTNLTPGEIVLLVRPHYSPDHFPFINNRHSKCARGLTRHTIITLSVFETESSVFGPTIGSLQSEYGILKAFWINNFQKYISWFT